jgi:hypothetical protein
MPRKGWKLLVLVLGLALSVFPPGLRTSEGNEIETKPGGLPVEGALPPIQTSLEFQ